MAFKFKHINNSLNINVLNTQSKGREYQYQTKKKSKTQFYTIYKTPTLKQGQRGTKNNTRR